MQLKAVYPILYRSHQYSIGDVLPTDDQEMVQAWIDAGTAAWISPEAEKPKAKPAAAQSGMPGASPNGETEENMTGRVARTAARSKGKKNE